MDVLRVMPGKKPELISIDGSLESMQQIVGGLIQAVYPFDDPVVLMCNDEGKLIGLEPNRVLRDPDTGRVYDIICGTFLICGLGQDDFTSLAPELIRKYQHQFTNPETPMHYY